MGRSQETFNKKENEKKKQQKKKEKQERKEERKANNNKGQTFEDMIAYVDENGNLTSKAPDLRKAKSSISAESIQIGVARQENVEPEDLTRKGKVTFFNESKGYGFIKDLDSQENIFVHLKGLIDRVKENDKVTFKVEKTPKGLSAFEVKLTK